MPTKSGKAKLSDLKAGKTFFTIATDFYPAYRRVVPVLRVLRLAFRPRGQEQLKIWKGALEEERLIFTSRATLISWMKLHGKDYLRQVNRENLERHQMLGVGGEYITLSNEELEAWMKHHELFYDAQIAIFARGVGSQQHSVILNQAITKALKNKSPLTTSGIDVLGTSWETVNM